MDVSSEDFVTSVRRRQEEILKDLPGKDALPAAASNSTRQFKPSYSLEFDVPDPETGQILYPAGYTYNPLDYLLPFRFEAVLINGTRQAEIAWIQKAIAQGLVSNQATICVLGGNYFLLSKKFGRPVFTGMALTKICDATPCLVKKSKGKNYFLIGTWKVEENER